MGDIAADALYEFSYRPSWGADDGLIGHVVIRRLDDHEIVSETPAGSEHEARALIARAETAIRGAADLFEADWGIGSDEAANPSPDVLRSRVGEAAPPAARLREPSPGERIVDPDPRVAVLPRSSDVFAPDQPWLARLLHPLASIELSSLDPAWTGRVHLLSPVEPLDGLIGEETGAHHDDFARENWISFRVESDGRYRFLGQRAFFEIEAARAAADAVAETEAEASGALDALDALQRFYADAEAQFAGARVRWERLGRLVWGDEDDPARQREGWGTDVAILDQLGGEPAYGNWSDLPPPAAFRLDGGDPASPVLRLADGRPCAFIAGTAGYPWRHEGADRILLFFEPETRTAVLTFDWG